MANRTPRRRTRRQPGSRRVLASSVPLVQALATVCSELSVLGVDYALVGGLAVSARAEPRLTRDVDLAVAVPDDKMAERQISALVGRGYAVTTIVEQTRTHRLATARLVPPRGGGLVVDLLFASCGIEGEIDHRISMTFAHCCWLRRQQIGGWLRPRSSRLPSAASHVAAISMQLGVH